MKDKELREAIAFLLELWKQEGREACENFLHAVEADVWCNPEEWTHAAAGAAVILESEAIKKVGEQ